MFEVICVICIIAILFGLARCFTGYGIVDGMIIIAVAIISMVYFSNPNNLSIPNKKQPQDIVSVQFDDCIGCED